MDWHPEKYSATGNIAGKGNQKLLGKPTLDPLELMVREAVQNSWDARKSDKEQIEFSIHLNKFNENESEFLKNNFFKEGPEDINFKNSLNNNGLYHIVLSDKNTFGLTGPSRANEVETEERNFVDFIRNIGSERDVDYGGGTYGYGKSSLYNVSQISTIIVFTNTKYNGEITHRLIACALGKSDNKYTGRHWWGKRANDGIVDPLEGEDAKKVARRIGMPIMEDGETGTTIMILCSIPGNITIDENTREREPLETLSFLSSSLYWYLWPKMIAYEGQKQAINFNIFLESQKLELFAPEDHPKLAHFIISMRNYKDAIHNKKFRKSEKNWLVKEIKHKSLKKDLGILVLRGHPSETITLPVIGEELQDKFTSLLQESIYNQSPFEKYTNHHIALMRNTELVIQYMEGQAPENNQYSGVFITPKNKEIDEAFAESEPPSHDKWEPAGLFGNQRKLVEHALRSLKTDMRDFSGVDEDIDPANDNFTPLTELSNKLSNLLPLVDSIGPSGENIKSRKETNGKIKNIPQINITGDKLSFDENEKYLTVSFLPNVKDKSKIIVKANAGICIDDGRSIERSSPLKTKLPKLVHWSTPTQKIIKSENCEIKKNDVGEWSVTFNIPSNAQISVNLEIVEYNA